MSGTVAVILGICAAIGAALVAAILFVVSEIAINVWLDDRARRKAHKRAEEWALSRRHPQDTRSGR